MDVPKVWRYVDGWGDTLWILPYREGDTEEDALERWNQFMDGEECVPPMEKIELTTVSGEDK